MRCVVPSWFFSPVTLLPAVPQGSSAFEPSPNRSDVADDASNSAPQGSEVAGAESCKLSAGAPQRSDVGASESFAISPGAPEGSFVDGALSSENPAGSPHGSLAAGGELFSAFVDPLQGSLEAG